jgi:DNA polymerase-3 subunit alpha
MEQSLMCKKDRFVSLHTHSCYSRDGLGTIEDLTDHVKDIGQRALAITDHSTMSSMVSFFLNCKERGIKPIFGNEMYFRYRQDKVNHITILARTQNGLNNLIKLNNIAHIGDNIVKRKSGNTPTIDMELLSQFSEGLIVLTGCVSSAIHDNEYEYGWNYTNDLIRNVGKDNVYGELMFSMQNQDFYSRVINICNDLKLQTVITTDAHFAKKEYGNIHPICVTMRSGYNYESELLYVMKEKEIKDLSLQYVPKDIWDKSLVTINEIVDSVEDIELKSEPKLPFVSQQELDEFGKFLQYKFELDLAKNDDKQVRIDRFNLEWKVITDKKFTDYFLILNDLYQFCLRENILMALRGSGAGCYILYLIGISQVDPIKGGLLFERFLNYERADFPDADCDISSNGREKVLVYALERWGLQPVKTYSKYSIRSLVHDLFRVLHSIPKDLEELICDYGVECDEYKKACEIEPRFGQLYDVMIDQVRHAGKHAGAVASTTRDVPVEDGLIALAEGNLKQLSYVGILKIDLLGIRLLDKHEYFHKLTGINPPDDPFLYPSEIFSLLQEDKTFNIFQIDASSGIKQLTKSINPDSFESISAAISLYRPGALDAGTAAHYSEYKINPRKLHSNIDKYLESTYGIILFQEQVMHIFAEITGTGLIGADLARKTLSPKSVKQLTDPHWIAKCKELENQFFDLGKINGYDKEFLNHIWAELLTHTRYSFNRAHSASYAFHALKDLWMLYYHPTEYVMSCLLVDQLDNNEDAQTILYYAAKNGVAIIPPHINNSSNSYELKDGKIYLPLTVITGWGSNSVNKVLEIRNTLEDNKFTSFEQMNDLIGGRMMNKTVRRKLYQIGAFDDIEGDVNSFISEMPLVKVKSKYAEFDSLGFVIPTEYHIKKIDKYANDQRAIVGFVKQKTEKETKTGKPMISYKLHPKGNFWMYNNEETKKLDIGSFVGVIYKLKKDGTNYGCANEVRPISIEPE